MTAPLKCLLIGTGSIGSRHARNVKALRPDTRFVFLRASGASKPMDQEFAATVVTQLEEALSGSQAVDFAIVASPSAKHIDVLPALIAANIPIYVEKPIVINKSETETIFDALRQADPTVVRVAGFNFRALPSLKIIAKMISQNDIGKVVRAHLSAGQWLPDWRPGQSYKDVYSARPELGGGVIFDLIHEIDLSCWWFGRPDKTHAFAASLSSLDMEVEDTATAMLSFADGPLVTIGLDYVARQRLRRYEIVGDRGSLIWDFGRSCVEAHWPEGKTDTVADRSDFDVAASYHEMIAPVLTAAEGTDVPEGRFQTLENGLQSNLLAIELKECAFS